MDVAGNHDKGRSEVAHLIEESANTGPKIEDVSKVEVDVVEEV